MKRVILAIILMLAMTTPILAAGSAAMAPSVAPAAQAASGIRVLQDEHQATFAQDVVFSLVAESDAPITRVALYRQLADHIVRVRTELSVQPATHVEEQFTWQVQSGEIDPGAELIYYWLIQDSAGHELTTAPVHFAYLDDRFDWRDMTQDPITVEYYGGEDTRAKEILNAALDAAQRLVQDIGVSLGRQVFIYVYNSQQDMQLALASRSSVYDAETITLGVDVGDHTLLILGQHAEVLATVAHEMSHIVVGLATENPYTDLPRWLDEGLAMYAEGELPSQNQTALQRAVRRDSLISVQSLSSYVGDPSQVDLFYGEAYSVVDFLLTTYGRDKMNSLLREFRKGELAETALQNVYEFGVEELDTQWRASLGLGPRNVATPISASSSQGSPCLGSLGGALILAVCVWAPVRISRRRHA